MNCRTVELSNLPCGSQDGELVDCEWLRVNWLIVWVWGIANAILYEVQIVNGKQHYLEY
ncbi:hypothetical protein [Echinicola salinicaeni]|uniref:hypothetical protein n=1 Tax=Echinicola salinicaeni TaxID=2762757 RepID=UPI001645E779|nr:hypothetical protein [Echinicola salinicaeni]